MRYRNIEQPYLDTLAVQMAQFSHVQKNTIATELAKTDRLLQTHIESCAEVWGIAWFSALAALLPIRSNAVSVVYILMWWIGRATLGNWLGRHLTWLPRVLRIPKNILENNFKDLNNITDFDTLLIKIQIMNTALGCESQGLHCPAADLITNFTGAATINLAKRYIPPDIPLSIFIQTNIQSVVIFGLGAVYLHTLSEFIHKTHMFQVHHPVDADLTPQQLAPKRN